MSLDTQKDNTEKRNNIIGYILVAAILVVALFLVARLTLFKSISLQGLTLVEWEEYMLVLVRSENDHSFQISNESEEAFKINKVNYMYSTDAEMSIYATVSKTEIVAGDRYVELEGTEELIGEAGFEIQPGEDFEIVAYFLGKKLGYNKFNGIRIHYTQDGQEGIIDLLTPDTYVDVQ